MDDQATLAVHNTRRAKDHLSHLHLIPIPSSTASEDDKVDDAETDAAEDPTSGPFIYDTVAMGGTFDHLHAGHRILLTMSAWLTGKRLICGVMDLDEERLARKKGASRMESLEARLKGVRTFLDLVRKSPVVKHEVVPISDAYGPTRDDPDVQAIVGSAETREGCEAVNTLRAELGLSKLDVHIIDVISPTSANVKKDDMAHKISSSAIRGWLERHDSA
ncbi:hypothetical protein HKX48_007934 [Thoreauomyces humboldtii]|nr:hypothetical protein HKX48_007934 [Thoreauomyces humboldtii]